MLARAVAAAVIDKEEAQLIAATRLGNATLAEAAAALEITPTTAQSWRRAAEKRLVAAIRDGDLAFVPLRPRRRPANGSPRPAVGQLLGTRNGNGVVLGTQQQALGGKTSDRQAAGVGAPGIGARPADVAVFAHRSTLGR